MTRIGQLALVLLLIGQSATAQNPTTYPSPFQSVPITQLAHQQVNIYNAYRLNSSGYEFSPSYYLDGIVYVSGQQDFQKDKKQPTSFFKLHYAAFDPDGMPGTPTAFFTQVNPQLHEGQASFAKEGTLIYYTSNSEIKSVEGDYSMKIYEARKSEKDWTHVVDLPFNSEAYSNQHPSISADGNTLYFASNMPGGYGGTDIYMVEKEGGLWGIPKNLGDQINTSQNDAFPFIHSTNYLFFASQGHGGAGDYDIFAVNIEDGLPGPLLHLDAPFNSPQADIGFILDDSSRQGFFASNRIGGSGQDDLYLFEAPLGVLRHTQQTTSKQAMPSKKEIVQTVQAPVKTSVEKKTAEATAAVAPPKRNSAREEIFTAKGIVPSKEVVEKKANQARVAIAPSATSIPKEKMVAVKKTASSKAKVEKKIEKASTSIIPSTIPKKKTSTQKQAKPAISKKKVAAATSYMEKQSQKAISVKEPISQAQTTAGKQLNIGTSLELNPIYYDLKNGTIRSVDAIQLNALVRLLKQYPSIEIEFIEHTDARGTAFYNQQLSQTRAIIAKNYLVNQGGIRPHRISAIGRGESQLRNHCKDDVVCSNQEHQYNRRVEVRIIRMREAGQVWFEGK